MRHLMSGGGVIKDDDICPLFCSLLKRGTQLIDLLFLTFFIQQSENSQATGHEDHPQRCPAHGVREPVSVAFDAPGGGDDGRRQPQREPRLMRHGRRL